MRMKTFKVGFYRHVTTLVADDACDKTFRVNHVTVVGDGRGEKHLHLQEDRGDAGGPV